jgi:hypothetical protein
MDEQTKAMRAGSRWEREQERREDLVLIVQRLEKLTESVVRIKGLILDTRITRP